MAGGFYTYYPPTNDMVVTSINGASGALTLVGGPGINVLTSGQTLTIDNTGVLSWNGATGAITLIAGSNITITPDGGGMFTIASTGGGGGGISTIGTFDSEVLPSANALTISGTSLIAQSASTSVPGMINTTTQSFAGNKTFTGSISAANLSGTNSGDVTIGTANGLSLTGQVLSLGLASTSTTGALSSTDWNTFNNKQPAGSYITALIGDGTASGPGSAALTLATVNSNVGTFGSASSVGTFTVNAKGLITAASNTSIQIAESQVTNLVSDLAGKQPIGNYITALTGDVTAAGPGSSTATLATVNANVGSFTAANITVNAKGLITAASSNTGVFTPVNMRATANNAQNYTSGSTSTVIFQTVVFDTNSGYNTSTGIYTVPANGVYLVSSALLLSSNTTGATTDFFNYTILHNGSEYSTVVSHPERIVASNATQQGEINDLVSCTAGDTLAIQVVSSMTNTYSQADAHSVNFCVVRVG